MTRDSVDNIITRGEILSLKIKPVVFASLFINYIQFLLLFLTNKIEIVYILELNWYVGYYLKHANVLTVKELFRKLCVPYFLIE